jgi:hypothetical protein
MTYCRRRPTTYLSVFGRIRFQRHCFYASGQASVSPLDAELSLLERCYSPLLRDWAGMKWAHAEPTPCSNCALCASTTTGTTTNASTAVENTSASTVHPTYPTPPKPKL